METKRQAGSRDQQLRAAQNQALFREVNERIESLNGPFTAEAPISDLVCECADGACTERIGVTATEYERVRGDGSRFLVAPADSHYFADVERVVERHERFWVVEKFEHAGRVASSLHPR